MIKQSAGLLVYRLENKQIKVLLGHMGGPFFARKDDGAWDIPKGEYEGEAAYEAARREFQEEIGQPAPTSEHIDLGEVKKSGKAVRIWAIEGDLDVSTIKSNNFELEWPPKSGQIQEFPEIDRAEWFDLPIAMKKIVRSRVEFLEKLAEKLGQPIPASDTLPLKPPQQSLF
jgi:predicted NUDIX family NTP pyrophosphohydrolase